jgi:hypothetical protein
VFTHRLYIGSGCHPQRGGIGESQFCWDGCTPKNVHKSQIPPGYCLAWDKEDCLGSYNSSPRTLGQASKLVCFCFVLDRKCSFIFYEVVVLQAGTSVLIDDSIGLRNIISGLYGGYINTLVMCECNGAENPWGKKLSLIDRVLAFPDPS